MDGLARFTIGAGKANAPGKSQTPEDSDGKVTQTGGISAQGRRLSNGEPMGQSFSMRVVIQRASEASVTINGAAKSAIGKGLLVLLAVEDADTSEDVEWLSGKIVRLRIFNDEQGLMNLSVQDVKGGILLVSQFTLFASTKKGNRRRLRGQRSRSSRCRCIRNSSSG